MLFSQIAKIMDLSVSTPGPAVGALTSENRDIWTDARESLIKASPLNAASLERIESAIVVVALDDTKPVTREDVSKACWTGDGRNRFYDKHQREHSISLTSIIRHLTTLLLQSSSLRTANPDS